MSKEKCKDCKGTCMSQEEQLQLRNKILGLMKESENHDHKTCNCEGCYWWIRTKAIFQNGRLYEMVSDWKEYPPEEFHRAYIRFLQYKMDKKLSKKRLITLLMKKKKLSREEAKQVAEQMYQPMFTIFYKPPPMGIMREI